MPDAPNQPSSGAALSTATQTQSTHVDPPTQITASAESAQDAAVQTGLVDASSLAVVDAANTSAAAMDEALVATGPFESVDLYCRAAMIHGYRRQPCQEASVALGRPACFCGQLPLAPAAPRAFTGRAALQQPAGAVLSAYVMARTNNPDADVACDLLLRTPAGMFAFAGLDVCAAPTSGQASVPALEVQSMRSQGGAATPSTLVVNWESRSADPQNPARSCRSQREVRCVIDAANVPSCVRRQLTRPECASAQP